MSQIKTLGENRIGGYGVVFGSPDERDLYGDWFSPRTELWLSDYANQPVLYDHTLSDLPVDMPQGTPRHFRLGRVIKATVDSVGLWVEAVIDQHNEWVDAVLRLIDDGVMHWSSGSAPHMVTLSPEHEILSWPVIEMSVTPHPAEPRNTGIVRLKHYVNSQDTTTPEASAQEAARRHAPVIVSNISQEDNPMTLSLSQRAVNALLDAILADNQDKAEIKSLLTAVKQDGNAIAELVLPVAESLAQIAGVDVETAQQYLIEFVASHAAASEPEAPAEEPAEAPMMEEAPPATLSHAVQAEVRRQVGALLPNAPQGGALVNTRSNTGRRIQRAGQPFSFVRSVGALARNDYQAIRAMGINPDNAGGFMVPTEHSTEVIELLRSGARVLPLCRVIPMKGDTMEITKQSTGASAYWGGENAQLTESTPTVGMITLVAKKLSAWVKISNELLEDSDPDVEAMIREDIANALAEKIDKAILEGSGVGSEPRGLANIADVTKTALNAAPTFANIMAAITRVRAENVRDNPAWRWVFHPNVLDPLSRIGDTTTGDILWTELGQQGHVMVGGFPNRLRGYEWVDTSQITVDTGNSNETKIYFGQWNDVVVGMRKTLELKASSEAGSSFEYDQTWIRAIMRLDINIRHAESIEILTDVRTS